MSYKKGRINPTPPKTHSPPTIKYHKKAIKVIMNIKSLLSFTLSLIATTASITTAHPLEKSTDAKVNIQNRAQRVRPHTHPKGPFNPLRINRSKVKSGSLAKRLDGPVQSTLIDAVSISSMTFEAPSCILF
jgi:hypothetical protein